MEEGTSGSRRTRSQVAPDWTVKDCLILVNEIAAIEADCSNALSSFQKWNMISENCNALEVHRTLNQCRRKWDSLVSDYNQIKKWESRGRSYRSLSIEKRKELKLPGNINEEIFEAINAVVMIQEEKAGTESDTDSDPEAEEEGSDILEDTAELAFAGSKRSRPRTMVAVKENMSQKTKKEEELRTNRVQEKTQQPAKTTHQSKSKDKEEKKPVEESSTDEEEEEMMNIEQEAEAMEAKLGEKVDLIHAIVGRKLAKDREKGNDNDEKMKFVREQGDELIACLSEIANTLSRLREVPQEIE